MKYVFKLSIYSFLFVSFFNIYSMKLVDSDFCPRAKGSWRQEWCWDWSRINTNDLVFPENFLWGTGTSSYQVEGGCTNNNWYEVELQTKEDGSPILQEKSGVTCDHWNRYKEDIQLMKQLGLKAYRFSIEWSKVEPEEGKFDQDALQHYADVCDELRANGIEPIVGFHHYTDPIWFAYKGGFEKKENIDNFVAYAVKVFEALQDKARIWITFNSVDGYAAKGYLQAMSPPYKKDMQLMAEVYKNILETHVRVYCECKERAKNKEQHKIGIMKNVFQLEPVGIFAKLACSIARRIKDDCFYNFFKTGNFGIYVPFKVKVSYTNLLAPQSIDFIGISYYAHAYMQNFAVNPDVKRTPTQNPLYVIYAEGLYRAIQEVSELIAEPLNIPIYITENGTAALNDETRDLFFKQYLYALSRAIQDGYDVRGYFYWSLMDNYEWGTYDKRYGLYHVNFETQERMLKNGTQHFINVINDEV